MTECQDPTHALVRKLETRDRLTAEERGALKGLMEPVKVVHAGQMLVRPGDRPTSSTLLIGGFCARFNLLNDGSRSFTQISVAGDFIDLHSLLMAQMDHGIVAVTGCSISKSPHDRLRAITNQHPHLARMLWLDTAIDAAIHRQWLHRMGTQDAVGRLAHLICETEARLAAVGLAGPDGFDFPLTQIDLADCLGMSAVHVNRTLMTLRRARLVEWHGGRVRIVDHRQLFALAEFDPVYLRLERSPV